MENKYLEKFFFIFFSIIPLSMILGPSVSLINIIIINFLFIYYLYISKDFTFLKNKIIVLLLILYIYLIFNSFISIDPSIGIKRNLGFLRFILLFHNNIVRGSQELPQLFLLTDPYVSSKVYLDFLSLTAPLLHESQYQLPAP